MNHISAEELRAAFDVVPNPLLVVDANGSILECNLIGTSRIMGPPQGLLSTIVDKRKIKILF